MKGGPACGSERDITGKKYVLLALFHYWLGFLIRGQGAKQRCLFDKARQFQQLLRCQITVVHHAALSLSLSLFLLLLQLLYSLPLALSLSLSLYLEGLCM